MVMAIVDQQNSSFHPGFLKHEPISPHMQNMASNDNIPLSANDKKRNKLGYHRTAVACGHCRRRKIRCIPSADTTSNRCQNCTRLKKDCQFYPVEQTTQSSTKRSRNDSKGDGMNAESEASVSSSSPGLPAGTIEQYDPYRPQLDSPTIARGGAGYPPLTSSGLEQDYDYQQQFQPTQWSQPGAVGQPARFFNDGRQPPDPHSYWPHSEQAGPGSFISSSYPLSNPASAAPISPPNSQFPSYPATTQDFRYSGQRVRDDNVQPNTSMNPYSLYRSPTMPDPSPVRDLHPTMTMPGQQMMSPPFAAGAQTNQYSQTPGMAPRWGDQGHGQPNFSPTNGNPAWYGGSAGIREEGNQNAQMYPTQRLSSGQFQSKPG